MVWGKLVYLKGILLVILSIFIIGGCAKTVKQEGMAPLPPVETLEEKPVEMEEPVKEPESSEIEIEGLEASVQKKTYPGIEGEFIETPMLKDCHFDFDRYDLTSEARKILAENAKILKKIPGRNIQVEGHCDERGTKEYNLALGERRAASVKAYLVSLGIPEANISTISYGEEMPLDDSHNDAAWEKNRRAHIIILSED